MIHPLRRRFLLEQLQRSGTPSSVLFLCHGNICRSPYAAASFARELPPLVREHVDIGSAGFIGPGRPPPENAIQVAMARGIDLREHRSRLVTFQDVKSTHLIVVMDSVQRDRLAHNLDRERQHLVLLGDLDPRPIDSRRVRDPILEPPEVFEQVYTRIDRCLRELVRVLSTLALPTLIAAEREKPPV